jgi:Zn-finger nucleic acid-binding protein
MDHDKKTSELIALQMLIAQSEDDFCQGRWLHQGELEELVRRRLGIDNDCEDL